jgi:hypothetical protein
MHQKVYDVVFRGFETCGDLEALGEMLDVFKNAHRN